MRYQRWSYIVFVLVIWLSTSASGLAAKSISVVSDPNLGAPARHGLDEVVSALRSKGYAVRQQTRLNKASGSVIFLLSTHGSSNVQLLTRSVSPLELPSETESLLVKKLKWKNKEVVFLYGADATGLMYEALDADEEVRLGSEGSDLINSVIET